MRKVALAEPQACDLTGKTATDTVPVLTLDLYTCTNEDCNFSELFDLARDKPENCSEEYVAIDGFGGWFEVEFTAGARVRLSTDPFSELTHWGQAAFYLDGTLLLKLGDQIPCRLEVVVNARGLTTKFHFTVRQRQTAKYVF
jgi:hypothetical protein